MNTSSTIFEIYIILTRQGIFFLYIPQVNSLIINSLTKSLNKSILFHSICVKESNLQKVHVYIVEYFTSLHLNPATVTILIIFFLQCVDFNITRLFYITLFSIIFTIIIFLILATFWGGGGGGVISIEDKSISDSRLHDPVELECKGLAMNQINLNQSN